MTMLAGHYATALIANQKFPKKTLLFFLFASQFQDFLWLTFHYLGLEPTGPHDVLDTTLTNLSVNMMYSHHALPQLFWAAIIFLIGRLVFKSNVIGLVGLLLFASHFVLDFFSGHPHHVFGAQTHQVGLGLYASHAYLAVFIEFIFVVAALWMFFRMEKQSGIERDPKNKWTIIALFAIGVMFMLFIATISMREWLSIPQFDLGFNTSVPTLILTYVAMTWILLKLVPAKRS